MNKKTLGFLTVLLCLSAPLTTLPRPENVPAGSAEFQVNNNAMNVVVSDQTIINYSAFSIDHGEQVTFVQPSSQSTVLNRVTGSDASKIYGSLNANGRVFLVNPNGMYFGPTAVVNTAAFVASTLSISDEDFLNGKYQFFVDSGAENALIVNEGLIQASPEGFVALMAPIIQNKGTIAARAGRIVLASAERVTLDFSGDGLLQFTVDGELKNALIENYGQIDATSGEVHLSMRAAQKAMQMVINTDGIKPATEIEESNGKIRLVSKSSMKANKVVVDAGNNGKIHGYGDIDATTAETGGTIHLLADNIHLNGSRIDASGDMGGGTILIGGDYQGSGDTPTATTVTIDNGTEIYADAIQQGDGGKVIVWADHTTEFNGNIYARGGAEGATEVSLKHLVKRI